MLLSIALYVRQESSNRGIGIEAGTTADAAEGCSHRSPLHCKDAKHWAYGGRSNWASRSHGQVIMRWRTPVLQEGDFISSQRFQELASFNMEVWGGFGIPNYWWGVEPGWVEDTGLVVQEAGASEYSVRRMRNMRSDHPLDSFTLALWGGKRKSDGLAIFPCMYVCNLVICFYKPKFRVT